MMAAPTSAAAVANEFLALGWSEKDGVVPPIDQMKLQKLLYYAHAWHLAMHDAPLFEDDIEAWPWGPVVHSIYASTKVYGKLPVGGRVSQLVYDADGVARFEEPRIPNEATKAFLKGVWESHKGFTGVQLSNSTHAPGEPWSIVKRAFPSLEDSPIIPNDVIKTVFKAKLHGAGAG